MTYKRHRFDILLIPSGTEPLRWLFFKDLPEERAHCKIVLLIVNVHTDDTYKVCRLTSWLIPSGMGPLSVLLHNLLKKNFRRMRK